MDPEVLAEWFRRRGIRVRKTESSYWYEHTARVFQAFPFHWAIDPPADEVGQILRHGALALRYSAPLGSESGVLGYHAVYDRPHYTLDDLGKHARRNVRRGLANARIERISMGRLAIGGWPLRLQTLQRQCREKAESQAWWTNLCTAADELPGFEAWAALRGDEMCASLLAFSCDDCFCLLYEQSATEHLQLRPNNALYFEVTRSAIARPHIKHVFAGLHGLDAPPSVDQFKFRMNFEPRLVKERVAMHPLLSPLASRASLAAARWVNARWSGRPRLRKFEGMVRTAVEGRLPVEEQTLPDAVAKALRCTGEEMQPAIRRTVEV